MPMLEVCSAARRYCMGTNLVNFIVLWHADEQAWHERHWPDNPKSWQHRLAHTSQHMLV